MSHRAAIVALSLLAGCSRDHDPPSSAPREPAPLASAPRGPAARASAPGAPGASAARAVGSAAPSTSAAVAQAPLVPRSEQTWRFSETPFGPMVVVVTISAHREGTRLPLLVAFHGRGEASKGVARGARGWVDDYWLDRALDRLTDPPLTQDDFLDLADEGRLARMNLSLRRRPFRGLVVLTPYTPDILGPAKSLDSGKAMAGWIASELLPKAQRELPVLGTPASTGVDGVSLGGRTSILVGLERPEVFGVLGAIQPAIDSFESSELTVRARAAKAKNPGLVFRLLTSEDDYFLVPTRRWAKDLQAADIDGHLLVVPGPHNYEFNRGPGVYELLVFHDRALRGEESL